MLRHRTCKKEVCKYQKQTPSITRISHLNRNRQVLGGLADWAGWRAGVLVVLVVLDKDKSLQRAGYKEIRPTRGGATTRQY